VILEFAMGGAELALDGAEYAAASFLPMLRRSGARAPSAVAYAPPGALRGAELIRAMGLRAVLKEDFEAHYRALVAPGFQAVAVYRIGTWVETIRAKPLRLVAKVAHKLAFLWVRNVYGIELEASVQVGRRFVIGHQSGIVIHKYASFGDDCLVRQNVTLGEGADGMVPGVGPVIGNRVSFSPGAVVIGNVVIGDNVTIGPNCVVTASIPANRNVFAPPPRSLPREGEGLAAAE
jgi:serine O-acetyltransferase